jgi:hypothetical protein
MFMGIIWGIQHCGRYSQQYKQKIIINLNEEKILWKARMGVKPTLLVLQAQSLYVQKKQ